jgi:hypothetical protein
MFCAVCDQLSDYFDGGADFRKCKHGDGGGLCFEIREVTATLCANENGRGN